MKLLLLALLLTACGDTGKSTFSASKPPQSVHDTFELHIREVPEQLPRESVHGTATLIHFPNKKLCVINLRKYPRCLLHEVRHCIEGDWHDPDVPNDEDCD